MIWRNLVNYYKNSIYVKRITMTERIKKISDRISGVKQSSKNETTVNKKSPTTQSLVKKMRIINEQEGQERQDRKTVYDQTREERNFRNNVKDLNVVVEFIELKVYDNFIYWGGTIDGVIQFAYKVTPDEETSGYELNYTDEFNPNNEENEEIVERIKNYYDQFYKYWRNNVIQT